MGLLSSKEKKKVVDDTSQTEDTIVSTPGPSPPQSPVESPTATSVPLVLSRSTSVENKGKKFPRLAAIAPPPCASPSAKLLMSSGRTGQRPPRSPSNLAYQNNPKRPSPARTPSPRGGRNGNSGASSSATANLLPPPPPTSCLKKPRSPQTLHAPLQSCLKRSNSTPTPEPVANETDNFNWPQIHSTNLDSQIVAAATVSSTVISIDVAE